MLWKVVEGMLERCPLMITRMTKHPGFDLLASTLHPLDLSVTWYKYAVLHSGQGTLTES